jgi:hypothetical protein
VDARSAERGRPLRSDESLLLLGHSVRVPAPAWTLCPSPGPGLTLLAEYGPGGAGATLLKRSRSVREGEWTKCLATASSNQNDASKNLRPKGVALEQDTGQ